MIFTLKFLNIEMVYIFEHIWIELLYLYFLLSFIKHFYVS